jgi:CHAT domain-containing protein
LLKCHQLEDITIDQITGFTSESQQLNRAADGIFTIQKYLYLIGRYYKNDQPMIQEAFNTWINGKGRIFDVQARLHESSAEGDNSESAALSQELSKVRRELSKLAYAKNSNVDGHEHRITELENRKDVLEIQLSRINKSFSSKRVVENADRQTISKMLPPGSVLLEFARTQAMRINKDAEEIDSYIAFIVHAETKNDIGMVKLGDADKIDGLIADYKKGLSSSGKNNGRTASAISKELYGLVFHPLVEHLGTSKDVFISPDGNLSLLPFEVLQQPDGSFLIDEFTFNYMATGRDLMGYTNDQVPGGRSLFMGAPDFQLAKSLNWKDKIAMLSIRSSDLGELSFVNLPYAKAELKSIRNVMGAAQSDLYIGKDALEETLLNANQPAIIHLATHGFFLSDQELPGTGRGFQMAELLTAGEQPHSQIKGKVEIENPLLRSGILLSGAQHSLTNGSNGPNDGIVTAEEILGMNLHGTEMVVLSACDTGLGDVKSGEGVFGLRRAFTQAGAKSLVMSLWKVPDKETKELMVQFYRNIKSGKMSRCQALRQAILKEKEIVRERYGHDNPRYWGAFVFMGQP